jgi:hypothetical protein
VIVPTLAPRVEERRERAGFRVNRTDIAPLPCIASKASIGKVIGIRLAAMFTANDVAYLVRRVRIAFMKKAIFTSKGGAFCDESPQRFTYVTGQAACVAVPAPWP